LSREQQLVLLAELDVVVNSVFAYFR